jgi:hypothetical protein
MPQQPPTDKLGQYPAASRTDSLKKSNGFETVTISALVKYLPKQIFGYR